MKLRTKIHSKYRDNIENTDIISLLTPSNKFYNNRHFVLSLMQNKLDNQEKEINNIIKSFEEKITNYYADKLNFYQSTTQKTLSYEGNISFLPPWYGENGKIDKYYIDNILDDSLKKDLKFLENNKTNKNNYKFDILDFDFISKSLSNINSDTINVHKSKKIFYIKIIFFILVIIAITLMILFFII